MSSQGEDKLKIPIEIKTEDLDEIRELINEISKAENDIRSLKATPRKGGGAGDTSSRSAFTTPEPRDGGIFGVGREGGALPEKPGKDKTSKTPFQRESEFAKLKNQVQEQEQKIGGFDAVQSGIGQATQVVGFTQLIGGGGAGILGGVAKAASKAFLPLAIATTVIAAVKGIIDNMLAPGGLLDRRWRRFVSQEVASAASLETKSKINQGFLIIRTQVQPGIRGEKGTTSSLANPQTYQLGLASNMAGINP